MNFKEHARYGLIRARGMTELMLKDFSTREEWLYRAHDEANHALWIAAHLSLADNMFVSRFRKDQAHKPEAWDELFWFGSEVGTDSSRYPAAEEVLAYMKDRRGALLKVLDDVTEDELSAPAPPPASRSPIAGAPCIGYLFIFAAYHEGLHAGQLSVARRGLGKSPIIQ